MEYEKGDEKRTGESPSILSAEMGGDWRHMSVYQLWRVVENGVEMVSDGRRDGEEMMHGRLRVWED